MNKIAIYPGTFDPITFGHIDVIKKAPTKLLASGCGDLIANIIAVKDWQLALFHLLAALISFWERNFNCVKK